MSSWRERFAPAIQKIILLHKGQPESVIRKVLRSWWDANLLGPRAHHPYKIFLSEINRQLGKKSAKKPVGGPSMFD